LDRPNVLPKLLAAREESSLQSGSKDKELADDVLRYSRQPGFMLLPWNRDLAGRRLYEAQERMNANYEVHEICRRMLQQVKDLETVDPDLAAEYCMANLRIGYMLQREGLVHQASDAAKSNGTEMIYLAGLRRRLSTKTRKKVFTELDSLEKSRDQQHSSHDEYWHSLNERWAFQLCHVVKFRFESLWGTKDKSYSRLISDRNRAMTGMFVVDSALRDFHNDNGKYPADLSSLTPKYLAEIPLDPFAGQPFVYRPTTEEFVLYSVGGDEKDNGGSFPETYTYFWSYDGFDLCLDRPYTLYSD